MNIHRDAEHRLIEDALAAAGALGLQGRVIEPGNAAIEQNADAVIELGRGESKERYVVEVKFSVTPANLSLVILHLRHYTDKPLLITRYVSAPMAAQLRELGVEFLDTAGNASLNRGNLVVWVKGEKPAGKPAPSDLGRAFAPSGLQVVFTLLCKPDAVNLSYRELAGMSDVALGTVQSVLKSLQALGHVRNENGNRRLFDLDILLRQWAEAYARNLRPKTLLGRYFAPGVRGWEHWNLTEGGDLAGAMWSGEPAGALLTNHLKPEQLTLYAPRLPTRLIARQKLLKQAEPGHSAVVEIRRRFWNFDLAGPDQPIVPPVLAYADLLASGDARCMETAALIYKERVARSFH